MRNPSFTLLFLCLLGSCSYRGQLEVRGDRTVELFADEMPRGDEVELKHTFTLTNSTDAVFRIARIETTCGCSEAVPSSTAIPAYGEVTLRVGVRVTRLEARYIEVRVFEQEDEAIPALTLGVRAYGPTVNVLVGPAKGIFLGIAEPGSPISKQFQVSCIVKGKDWIEAIAIAGPEWCAITIEPAVKSKFGLAGLPMSEFVVQLKGIVPTKLPGIVQELSATVPNHPEIAELKLPLSLHHTPLFTASPSVITPKMKVEDSGVLTLTLNSQAQSEQMQYAIQAPSWLQVDVLTSTRSVHEFTWRVITAPPTDIRRHLVTIGNAAAPGHSIEVPVLLVPQRPK